MITFKEAFVQFEDKDNKQVKYEQRMKVIKKAYEAHIAKLENELLSAEIKLNELIVSGKMTRNSEYVWYFCETDINVFERIASAVTAIEQLEKNINRAKEIFNNLFNK